MAWSSFLYPKSPYDLGSRVQPLPDDGSVPGLPGWRWLHTPGHTPGHVSFLRQADRVVVVGDAFTTVVGESALATISQKQVVHGPPAYFTPDWDAARTSVAALLSLVPEVAATGHGIAMHGDELRHQLEKLAVNFNTQSRPKVGRYAHHPAVADASGVRSVPPPLVSPVVKGLAIAATLLTVIGLATTRKKKKLYRAPYRDHPA
jgi:glyoxylase-like metal-dependent hydrolase (beta-lactamase superfamily II)